MFKKLRTVIYHVDDLQKAKAWYIAVTGVTPYFDQPFYVGFDINGAELGLDPDMTGVTEGNKTVAYWSVEDIASVVRTLEDAGAEIIKPPEDVGGDMVVAIFRDPFGNTVGLIEGA